jgi:hypothetical protein
VVDVVEEADLDAACDGLRDRAADDGRSLGLEMEVVLREVERAPCAADELGDAPGHVERGLAAVGMGRDLEQAGILA